MRIIVLRRKWAAAAGCLCAAVAMFWVVSHPAAVGAAAEQRPLPVYCVEVPEGEKQIALTFDAAWGDVRVRQC